jgi:hypothetical protein
VIFLVDAIDIKLLLLNATPVIVRNLVCEIPLQLILADAADVAKPRIHRDVLQLVEIGKDAYLRELGSLLAWDMRDSVNIYIHHPCCIFSSCYTITALWYPAVCLIPREFGVEP